MNRNINKIVEGNWDELKGKIKKNWGKLTDDDISQIDGYYDKLAGKLKKTYGYSEDELVKQLEKFLDDSHIDLKGWAKKTEDEAAELMKNGKHIKEDIEKTVLNSFDNIKAKSINIEENVVGYIKENPIKSVVFAAFIGIVFSKFYINKK